MSGKFGIRVGEALVAGGPPGTAAEPEVAIGEMDGPFGTAFANLLGNQVAGHSRVLAIVTVKELDHKLLFNIHRDATAKSIKKAMYNEPSIEWLLENQDKIVHIYFERGLKGEI